MTLRDVVLERTWAPNAARRVPRISRRRAGQIQFTASVEGVGEFAPGVRRVTLSAPELAWWQPSGPDEFVGLLLARQGRELRLPDVRRDVRSGLADLPAGARPDLRWYTISRHRPLAAEADFDIVLHAGAGPGTSWAARAEPGQIVGVRTNGSRYAPPPPGGGQLLVADETALPALTAILREQPTAAALSVHVEVPSRDFVDAYRLDAYLKEGPGHPGWPWPEVTVYERGERLPGVVVIPALERRLRAAARPADSVCPAERVPAAGVPRRIDYAWICGEAELAAGVRRQLICAGVARRSILCGGYWRLGAARR